MENLDQKPQQNDSDLFWKLAEDNKKKLFFSILRIIKNREQAEDLTHEAILRAFQAWGNFRWEAQFFTWLNRIGINTTLHYLTKEKRYLSIDIDIVDFSTDQAENFHYNDYIDYDTPEFLFRKKILLAALSQKLEKMSPCVRVAFILRHHDEMSYEMIAKRMKCAIGTVRSRLHRGRQDILEVFSKNFD